MNLPEGRGAALPESFALGLYAYVRQAALSLHRAHGELDALTGFLREREVVPPGIVLERLASRVDASRRASMLSRALNRLRRGNVWLPGKQAAYVMTALAAYDRLLRCEGETSLPECTDVRMPLSYSEGMLRSRLPRRLRRLGDPVEHLCQAPFNTHRPLEDIAGADWLAATPPPD